MEVIYGLIPGMLILGLVAVGVLFWAARSGQFDDLDGDAHRILMDDDLDEREVRRLPDAEDSGADVHDMVPPRKMKRLFHRKDRRDES